MKLKKFVLCVMMIFALVSVVPNVVEGVEGVLVVSAIDDLEESADNSSESESGVGGTLSEIVKGNTVSSEDLAEANKAVSPITGFIGTVVGFIVVLLTSGIFLITAVDLIYIALPFTRSLLFVDGQAGIGQGMGNGMGFGGYQSGMSSSPTHEKRQWVSDEAVQCVAMMGNNQTQNSFGMSQTNGGTSQKSVLITYLKKRAFFLVLFSLCLIVLTSSVLMDTGINLAQWATNLIEAVNEFIPN